MTDAPESAGSASRFTRWTSSRAAVIVVFCVALFARVGYIVVLDVDGLQTGYNYAYTDVQSYHWMAENLVEHGNLGYRGEPSARRGPGYPLFLTAFYVTVGQQHTLIRIVQMLLDAVGAVAVALTLRLLGEAVAGFFSGLTYALYPIYIYNSAELMTEALVVPLFAIIVYMLLRVVVGRARLWTALFAGMTTGYMFLVRENNILLPIPIALLLWFFLRRPFPKLAVKAPLVFLVGFVLLWSPWVVRNYQVFGVVSFGGSTGGENLIRSMNMAVHGLDYDKRWHAFRDEHGLVVYDEYHDPKNAGETFPDEWESDRKTKQLAWAKFKAHPGDFFRFGLYKTWYSLTYEDPFREKARQGKLRLVLVWLYRVLAVFGIWGIVLAVKRRYAFPLAMHALNVGAALFLIFTMPAFVRYRFVSVDLAFVTFAGLALAWIHARFFGRANAV